MADTTDPVAFGADYERVPELLGHPPVMLPALCDLVAHASGGGDGADAGPEGKQVGDGRDPGGRWNEIPPADRSGDGSRWHKPAPNDAYASSDALGRLGRLTAGEIAAASKEAMKRAGARLAALRLERGFPSASAFARHVSEAEGKEPPALPISTYIGHENGNRALTAEADQLYARYLGVPVGAIRYGSELPMARDVPIVGVAKGATEKDYPTGVHDKMLDSVQKEHTLRVDLTDLVAHQVEDDALDGYRRGDMVLHRALTDGNFDLSDLHGRDCIVRLDDDSILLRRVVAQRDGLATLITDRGQAMMDIRLRGAERIRIIIRSGS